MGQETKIIDPAKVEELAAQGLSMKQIALCLGIARSTLYKKRGERLDISDAIERGRAQGLQKVANALFENCMKGNYQAQQFYLRNRDPERWKDHRDLAVSDGRKAASELTIEELSDIAKQDKAA